MQINLECIRIGAHDFDAHPLPEPEGLPAALAAQHMVCLVVFEIVTAQFGDVNHAVNQQLIHGHKNTEAGHAADRTVKLGSHVLARVHALEPRGHFARGFVGATLVLRAMHTERVPIGLVIFAPANDSLDRAMHHQIRIAPDRRGEVGIALIRQPEMADIVGAVLRLLHRAQHDTRHQHRVRPAFDEFGQLGVILGLRIIAAAQRQTETAQKLAQVGQLGRRRAGMDAVQGRVFVLLQNAGRAHIGGEHAFLNQLVGVIAHHLHHALDATGIVEDQTRLHRFKIHRTALAAPGQQRVIHVLQRLQRGQQLFAFLRRRASRVGQNRCHLGVGEARLRMHHALIELVGLNLTCCGDHHVAYHHETVHLGVERTQTIGQFFRQHRYHAAWKIN